MYDRKKIRSAQNVMDVSFFVVYALETVAFTLNRAPSKSVESTPYEVWFGNKPKLSFLKVPGCDAYAKSTSTPRCYTNGF